MKLSIPELREEIFEVKTSVKNIKKMHDYQLKLVESSEKLEAMQDGSFNELTKAIAVDDMNFIENAEKFISDILSLTKKEVEKLEDFERVDFMNLQSKIVLALQGYEDTDINELLSEEDSDEKKAQPQKKEKSITTIS